MIILNGNCEYIFVSYTLSDIYVYSSISGQMSYANLSLSLLCVVVLISLAVAGHRKEKFSHEFVDFSLQIETLKNYETAFIST